METLIIVCVVLLMVAVGFVTVYVVQTLAQVKRTMRSVESLSEKLNREMDKVQAVTDAASNVANALSGSFGKTASLAFSLIKSFLQKRKDRNSDSAAESEHAEAE